MRQPSRRLLASLVFVFTLILGQTVSASGQEGVTTGTTTTIESRGVGFKGANVFNPKYKQRIATYKEQLQMGATRGWLTPQEVESFTSRLNALTELEARVDAAGWQKADVDDIDKQFTKFNMDLTAAANKPVSPPPEQKAKPAGTVSDGARKTVKPVQKATAKTTGKTKKTR